MPQAAAPLAGRGRVHLAVGRPHAAIRDFTRAVTADPRFATAYRSRAEAKLDIGRYEEAIEDLSRAIAFDVGNVELYLLRGQRLSGDRQHGCGAQGLLARDRARSQARPAAMPRAGSPPGSRKPYEQAFADLNRAIELDPRSGVAFAYRAVVYKLSGQADVGVQGRGDGAEARARTGPRRLWAKAEIEEAQGRTELAVADFKRALALKPGLKLAADGLQRLGADLGDEEDHEVPGLGIDKWRVVERGGRYFAVSDQYRRLRVPLEMAGEGQPRLLEWEIKPPPLSGVATLRFNGGVVPGRMGPEEVEQVAILDLDDQHRDRHRAAPPGQEGRELDLAGRPRGGRERRRRHRRVRAAHGPPARHRPALHQHRMADGRPGVSSTARNTIAASGAGSPSRCSSSCSATERRRTAPRSGLHRGSPDGALPEPSAALSPAGGETHVQEQWPAANRRHASREQQRRPIASCGCSISMEWSAHCKKVR